MNPEAAAEAARMQRDQIKRARPAILEILAILGKGVSPQALAAGLAIQIEDSSGYAGRAERIAIKADLLAATAAALQAEAERRKGGAL